MAEPGEFILFYFASYSGLKLSQSSGRCRINICSKQDNNHAGPIDQNRPEQNAPTGLGLSRRQKTMPPRHPKYLHRGGKMALLVGGWLHGRHFWRGLIGDRRSRLAVEARHREGLGQAFDLAAGRARKILDGDAIATLGAKTVYWAPINYKYQSFFTHDNRSGSFSRSVKFARRTALASRALGPFPPGPEVNETSGERSLAHHGPKAAGLPPDCRLQAKKALRIVAIPGPGTSSNSAGRLGRNSPRLRRSFGNRLPNWPLKSLPGGQTMARGYFSVNSRQLPAMKRRAPRNKTGSPPP
jgi:hypothetical protein